LSKAYKILSYILLSNLTLFAEEITENHECGFGQNKSTTDYIFSNAKKWEYSEAVRQLYIDFKKA